MAAEKAKKKKELKHRLSMRVIAGVVLVVCGILFVKTYQVNRQIDAYKTQEEDLKSKISDADDEKKDIEDKISYMKSKEYIEEQAREKLGLVFDNEIIFKKKD